MAKKPTKQKEPTYILVNLSESCYFTNQTKDNINQYVREDEGANYLVIDKNNVIYKPEINTVLKLVKETVQS